MKRLFLICIILIGSIGISTSSMASSNEVDIVTIDWESSCGGLYHGVYYADDPNLGIDIYLDWFFSELDCIEIGEPEEFEF